MIQLYAATSFALCLLIIGIFFYNLYSLKVDAMSIRNLFLLGFAHFYCIGGYFTVTVGFHTARDAGTESAFIKLMFLTPIFLTVFLGSFSLVYRKGWLQRFVPSIPMPVTSPALILSILVLISGAMVAAIAPPQNFLGLFIVQFRSGMSATAMALATYYLLATRFNPMSWLIFIGTLGLAAIASTAGGSGRRGLVAVLLAVPWIWYYFSLRYKKPSATVIKIGTVGAMAVVFLAAYGSYRQQGGAGEGVSAGVRAEQMKSILTTRQIDEGHLARMAYTDTVLNTLFIIEHYPDDYALSPFFGVKWFLLNPVPRILWAGKPDALGITLREQMGTAANLGPGVIGHGWSEAVIVGVLYYAIFFGALTGICDGAIRRNIHNPFFVAVMISGGGNIIGLPRGDTPLFLLQITAVMVASFGTLYFVKLLFGTVVGAFPPLLVPQIAHAYQDQADDEYWDEEDS